MKSLVVFVLLAVLIVVGPIFGIWSINTLFKTGIPYTFKTWVAMVCLELFVLGGQVKAKAED
jgi:hypothetical protein